jgi:hypothetical protein
MGNMMMMMSVGRPTLVQKHGQQMNVLNANAVGLAVPNK